MDIGLVELKDTHGALAYDVFKIDIEESAAKVWLSDNPTIGDNSILNMIYNNIDYRAIPGADPAKLTYKFVLTYNGTMFRNDKTYAQLIKNETGKLDPGAPPLFTYSPEGLKYPQDINPQDVILNVHFLTGEANILQFKGVPVGGNNGPFEYVAKYSYPFSVSKLPNTRDGKTYMDGWYSGTFAVYKDKLNYSAVVEGDIFGFKGKVYTATVSGILTDLGTHVVVVDSEGVYTELVETTFEEFMVDINSNNSIVTNAPHHSVTTQVLVTSELNEAMINQLLNTATSTECDDKCAIANWQKLQQKRIGAYIQFDNSNFRKAQVIIESSRTVCANRHLKNCN
jgi:hypothetical protein